MIAKLFPRALLAVSIVLAATPLLALMPTGPSSKFEVTAPTQVPGLTLPAGSFSLTVVDHLTDRYIVRVEDQSGGVLATFLGIPDSELSNRAGTGMILWNAVIAGPSGICADGAFLRRVFRSSSSIPRPKRWQSRR